jgi:hypothetical protein
MKLSEFILLGRKERTQHIDLNTECELKTLGRRDRGGLDTFLDLLGVEDDINNWTNAHIHICHLCDCGRRKGDCGNIRHIYIGTARENALDNDEEFRKKRGKLMISARKEWKPHINRERFLLDVELDRNLLSVSSRKLAEKYGVSHFTVQKWKKLAL